MSNNESKPPINLNRLLGDGLLSHPYIVEIEGLFEFNKASENQFSLDKKRTYTEIVSYIRMLNNKEMGPIDVELSNPRREEFYTKINEFYLDIKLVLIALNLYEERMVGSNGSDDFIRTLLDDQKGSLILESIKNNTYEQDSLDNTPYKEIHEDLRKVSNRIKELARIDSDSLYKHWQRLRGANGVVSR